MNAERWQQIERVCQDALAREPTERASCISMTRARETRTCGERSSRSSNSSLRPKDFSRHRRRGGQTTLAGLAPPSKTPCRSCLEHDWIDMKLSATSPRAGWVTSTRRATRASAA